MISPFNVRAAQRIPPDHRDREVPPERGRLLFPAIIQPIRGGVVNHFFITPPESTSAFGVTYCLIITCSNNAPSASFCPARRRSLINVPLDMPGADAYTAGE